MFQAAHPATVGCARASTAAGLELSSPWQAPRSRVAGRLRQLEAHGLGGHGGKDRRDSQQREKEARHEFKGTLEAPHFLLRRKHDVLRNCPRLTTSLLVHVGLSSFTGSIGATRCPLRATGRMFEHLSARSIGLSDELERPVKLGDGASTVEVSYEHMFAEGRDSCERLVAFSPQCAAMARMNFNHLVYDRCRMTNRSAPGLPSSSNRGRSQGSQARRRAVRR